MHAHASLLASYGPGAMTQMENTAWRPAGQPRGPAGIEEPPAVPRGVAAFWGILSLASMAASAYHGVQRNRGSVGWGIAWGLAGATFPIITPAIALGQGFAEPARS